MQVMEKIVDRPVYVEKIVEKFVDKIVEKPVYIDKVVGMCRLDPESLVRASCKWNSSKTCLVRLAEKFVKVKEEVPVQKIVQVEKEIPVTKYIEVDSLLHLFEKWHDLYVAVEL